MSDAEAQPIRRRAQQARSIATFERIMTAAGELFDELGLDGTSMEAIAARAEVSIGSVYRFFENKPALIIALGERVGGQFEELARPWFSERSLHRDVEDVVDEFLETLRAFMVGSPGTRALLATAVLTGPMAAVEQPWVEPLRRFLERYAPKLPEERQYGAVATLQTITVGLMISAAYAGDDLDARLREARSVLIGYVDRLNLETS